MKNYKTKDLYEASAIYASGKKLLKLEEEGKFYWFIYKGNECGELANKYWSGELNLSAKVYADAIRTLKDRVFAQR